MQLNKGNGSLHGSHSVRIWLCGTVTNNTAWRLFVLLSRSLGCWWWTQRRDTQLRMHWTIHSSNSMWWQKFVTSVHTGSLRWGNMLFWCQGWFDRGFVERILSRHHSLGDTHFCECPCFLRSYAWLCWPPCESIATTAAPSLWPKMWYRATLTQSSPSASSSTPVPSRSMDTGWRRARLRTEQPCSRTLPKPFCCLLPQSRTPPLSTHGNIHWLWTWGTWLQKMVWWNHRCLNGVLVYVTEGHNMLKYI